MIDKGVQMKSLLMIVVLILVLVLATMLFMTIMDIELSRTLKIIFQSTSLLCIITTATMMIKRRLNNDSEEQ
jgi:hypothetical protein